MEEEEGNLPLTRNSFVPSLLPQFENKSYDDHDVKTVKIIQLTNNNARNYAGTASYVGWKGRVDYALDYLETNTDFDANFLSFLLETVISTVILLASGGIPQKDYFLCSQLFLENIRNEFGELPPNIAAFLDYINSFVSSSVQSNMESLHAPDKDLPSNLVITQIPKALQQRLCK